MADCSLHTCNKAGAVWQTDGPCAECQREQAQAQRLADMFPARDTAAELTRLRAELAALKGDPRAVHQGALMAIGAIQQMDGLRAELAASEESKAALQATLSAVEHEVAIVYCHITNNAISKCITDAQTVIAVADDVATAEARKTEEQLAMLAATIPEILRLRAEQESIVARRARFDACGHGKFGIAVHTDALAVEWQALEAQLSELMKSGVPILAALKADQRRKGAAWALRSLSTEWWEAANAGCNPLSIVAYAEGRADEIERGEVEVPNE